MSFTRKTLPLVLTFAVVIGTAITATAGPGIWMRLPNNSNSVSITLINLTDEPLLITGNNIVMHNHFSFQGRDNPPEMQSIPFQGNDGLHLDPYRSAVWKSASGDGGGPCTSCEGSAWWDGQLKLLPESWDPKWTLTLNFKSQSPAHWYDDGKGTWVTLSVATNPEWGTLQSDPTYGNYYPAGWRYSMDRGLPLASGIWATQVFNHQITSGSMWNVFTASSNEVTVSLYAYGSNNRHLALIIRQTNWDGLKNDDYRGWRLDFVDNNDDTIP